MQMKKMQTIEQLKRSMLVFSVLSILIVGAIVAIAAIYPLSNQLKKNAGRNLLQAAGNRKLAIEQFFGKLEQTAWQITSRTRIREKLEQYNRGEVDRKQLIDFVKPKLEDALLLSKQAVGCLRFDINGQPVVQAGEPLPESFRLLTRQQGAGARMQGPVSVAGALYMVIEAPIFNRKKVRVGTDRVMFRLDELQIIVQDNTGLGETGETLLGMVSDNARVRLVFPPRKTTQTYVDGIDIASPLGLAMKKAVHLGRDEPRLFTSASDASQVFACVSIPRIRNWAIVVRMSAKELYAPINRQLFIISLVIFALLMLGTLAAMLLLRPLAGKIVIHAEELESITRQLVQEADERQRLQEELLKNYHDMQESARQLEQSRNMLQLILESIPVRVFWKDRESRFLGCNTLFARDAGFGRPEQLLGQDDFAMVWREQAERYQADDREIMASGRPRMNIIEQQTTPSGAKIWLSTSKVPLQLADGEIIGVLGAYEDITASRQAEAELVNYHKHLEEQVKGRTAELESANRELESFAYSVSHDLRAPLRHIDGFMQLLQKKAGALDEKCRHYMDAISDAALKMGKLIDNLLSFSRMGRHAMTYQQVDLGMLVREVIRELEPDAAGRNIDWHIGDLPVVAGDAATLRMVLANLVDNALKFTRPRQEAKIEIGTHVSQSSETVVFVRDNGVGFDMAYADKLFGVFQRLHRTEEFEGTGIGLANVRRIITRHGGRTWAEGKLDQGAAFFFALPPA
jgi:PAS domain S-box-containing protein